MIIDWDMVIRIGHMVVSLVIIPGVYYLRGIQHTLDMMNDRMIRQETWRAAHDKQDDERHEDVNRRLHVVERRVDRFHPGSNRTG